jgi:RNA polymerase sigma-70 factor (ECF subfamily)
MLFRPRQKRLGVSSSVEAEAREVELIARLRAGEEAAFRQVLRKYHNNMIALARTYLRQQDIAEEVVQETWLAVIKGLDHFEQRSSFKTWIYSILLNKAKTRAVRDGRVALFSELARDGNIDDPAIDPERFSAHGEWLLPPAAWETPVPEREVSEKEMLELVRDALDGLPPSQRAVVLLRDVEGVSAQKASDLLGISEGNLRVLLHRGRNRLRAMMEGRLAGPSRSGSGATPGPGARIAAT